jgi:hypothetical protein
MVSPGDADRARRPVTPDHTGVRWRTAGTSGSISAVSSRSELESLWASVRALFAEARRVLPTHADVAAYEENVAHNELELALDALAEVGETLRSPPRFWSLLERAAEAMSLDADAQRLRWRRVEAERGYLRVSLKLTPPIEGRKTPISSGYRACWDIGATHDGVRTFNDAPITIEYARSIEPGADGTVRLHPLAPEFWTQMRAGHAITMYEGSRVVGHGVVLEVVPPADGAEQVA